MAVVIVVSLAFVIVNGIDAYDRVNQRIENPEGETVPVDTGGDRQVVNAGIHHVTVSAVAKALPAGVPAVNPFDDAKIYFNRFVQRFGSFVTFDLNGRSVFAVPKPRQPMDERVATMERSAISLVSGIP